MAHLAHQDIWVGVLVLDSYVRTGCWTDLLHRVRPCFWRWRSTIFLDKLDLVSRNYHFVPVGSCQDSLWRYLGVSLLRKIACISHIRISMVLILEVALLTLL